jgi:hypothetical protein
MVILLHKDRSTVPARQTLPVLNHVTLSFVYYLQRALQRMPIYRMQFTLSICMHRKGLHPKPLWCIAHTHACAMHARGCISVR